MKDYKNMTNEEIKEKFIKWFGEEKWEEEEKKEAIKEIVDSVILLEEPNDNNYIKEVHVKFSTDGEDHIDTTISGDILNGIEDLPKNYEENTVFEKMINGSEITHKNIVTNKMIIEYVKNNYNLSVSSNNIAEVKVKNNLQQQNREYKKSKTPCPENKVNAIENAFKHFNILL
ncbi:MAG: hypothetical protein MR357_04690 [Anaeroplasma sp.]|nr:hypothetical protein [Anaeroplasma sp.]